MTAGAWRTATPVTATLQTAVSVSGLGWVRFDGYLRRERFGWFEDWLGIVWDGWVLIVKMRDVRSSRVLGLSSFFRGFLWDKRELARKCGG